MTEVESALLRLTGTDPTVSTDPKIDTAKRCGALLALLSRAHAAAFRALGQTVADKRLRRCLEFPAAALADAMADAATLYPKLKDTPQSYMIGAIADAVNGLEIPVRFLPAERAAFMSSYLFSVNNHRPLRTEQKG